MCKTIKEKARIAWERNLEVVADDGREGLVVSWGMGDFHIATMDDTKRYLYEDNDIRFVDESETREEEIRRICDAGYEDKSMQLHETTLDERVAENEDLQRDNSLLRGQVECLKAQVAECEEPPDVPDDDPVIHMPPISSTSGVIITKEENERRNQELSQLRAMETTYLETIRTLQERLTVAEAGSDFENVRELKQCKVVDFSAYNTFYYMPDMNCSQYDPIDESEEEEPIEGDPENDIDSVREELTHAKNWGYDVMLVSAKSEHGGLSTTWRGRIRSITSDKVLYNGREYLTFHDGNSVFLDLIHSVIILYADQPDKPDEPEDIAKQRWGWRPVGTGEGLVRLDKPDSLSYIDSLVQKRLQAAAPELLDVLESYGDPNVGLAEFYKRKNAVIQKVREVDNDS